MLSIHKVENYLLGSLCNVEEDRHPYCSHRAKPKIQYACDFHFIAQ